MGRIISSQKAARREALRNENPWIPKAPATTAEKQEEPAGVARLRPRAGAIDPPVVTLPVRPASDIAEVAGCFLVGAHGGAGESTLATVLKGAVATGHTWPGACPDIPAPRAIVVCRSNAAGLESAQRALAHWASGSLTAELLGLAVLADAPGRRPRFISDLVRHVGAGVPGDVWEIPWVEQWRLSSTPTAEAIPTSARRALTSLERAIDDSRLPSGPAPGTESSPSAHPTLPRARRARRTITPRKDTP